MSLSRTFVLLTLVAASANNVKADKKKDPNIVIGSKVDSAPMPQKSPIFQNLVVDSNAPTSYKIGSEITGALPTTKITLQGYPEPWKTAETTSAEVKAAIAAIDFSLVPNAPVRTANKGSVAGKGYDVASDPYCWWTQTGCMKPKASNIPTDQYTCPEPKTWGLTYDDGPLVPTDGASMAEPHLYDFLAQTHQTAQLFYIGSNVIQAPLAAQRALADGHIICVHTWSHQAMTSLTNEQVVAELYWTLKAIKSVVGITPKCWRPPFGDVDDRVRAIAYQMGLTNWLWDQDTDDWNIKGAGGGSLSPDVVDGYFQGWIQGIQNGSMANRGTITLQHEVNAMTVTMAEKWLPKIQATYTGGVMPGTACNNISQPYWETQWVYKTVAQPTSTSQNTIQGNSTSGNTTSGNTNTSGSSAQSLTNSSNSSHNTKSASVIINAPITFVITSALGIASLVISAL